MIDKPVLLQRHLRPLRAELAEKDGRTLANVGAFHGYKKGVGLQTRNAKAVIQRSYPFFSLVQIQSGAVDADEAEPAEVVETPVETTHPPLRVRFSITRADSEIHDAARALARRVDAEPFVDVLEDDDAEADVAIRIQRANGGVQFSMVYPGGRSDVVGSSPDGSIAALYDGIRGRLAQAYAVQRMAQLENPHAAFHVKVQADRGGSRPRYHVGESMSMRVKATMDCYVTIIDIGTSGNLSVVYPPAGQDPPKLRRGQVLTLPARGQFKVQGPPGLNRIKVIATRQPLDLSTAVRTKGLGCVDTAEQIVAAMRPLGTSYKGIGDLRLPADAWAESGLLVEIVP
jgi:hypothetical protein